MAVIAWEHLHSTKLWRLGFKSLVDFREAIGWNNQVRDMIQGGNVCRTLRQRTEAKLQSNWQCSLEDLFFQEERPSQYSKHFLEKLSGLAGSCSREEGLRRIRLATKNRQGHFRSRQCHIIIPLDLDMASRSLKEDLKTAAAARNNPRPDRNDNLASGDEDSTLPHRGKSCFCLAALRARLSTDCWRRFPVSTAEVEATWITGGNGSEFCHRHLRVFAGRGLYLCTNRSSKVLSHRTKVAVRWFAKSDIEQLRKNKPHWFKTDGDVSLWRFTVQLQTDFVFDPQPTFERFTGVGSWNTWLADGNIIIPDFFKYLFADEMTPRIESEYDAYRYHTQLDFHGKARNGWTRTMFYSLIQQLVRQDPGYYAIMAAARPDRNWRLISYPYYTKDTVVGESTGFKHLDLNVPALLETGRGANIIQTTLSLDDEDEDGCTILVPGFHRCIRQWWEQVEARGVAADGLTTNVSQIYTSQDKEKFGSFVPVPCKRGGVRISRPELIHGSTSVSTKRRRTVFVWHCGIKEDHVRLDNEESETWDEVARCHREMDTPLRSTSGHGFAYGKPTYRFPAATRLASTSAIGDALIGLRRWDEPGVIHERNILLGSDEAAANAYIKET